MSKLTELQKDLQFMNEYIKAQIKRHEDLLNADPDDKCIKSSLVTLYGIESVYHRTYLDINKGSDKGSDRKW